MADLTRIGLNNQKRQVSVGVGGATPTTENTIFNLPPNSVVLGATLIVLAADTAAGATMDVTVDGTVVADELGVSAVGTNQSFLTPAYFATGGVVGIAPGTTAPAGDGSVRLVVEYIELDKTTGEYTN